MSSVSAVATPTTTTELETSGSAVLDQEDFMTLFITQLQYQDPMEPMDSTEMASQMAEFSNMEATLEMANNIEELLEYQTSQNNLQLVTLLDEDVRVVGNGIGLNEGVVGTGEYSLEQEAETVVLTIVDAAGRTVDTIDLGAQAVGSHIVEWDGNDSSGNPMEDGGYYYSISAYTEGGESVVADYYSIGTVTAVDYSSGSAMLIIDGYIPADVGSVVSVI